MTDYIFGYGSLINRESRMRTTPDAFDAAPVIAKGLARGWWVRGQRPGLGPCFLAVEVQADAVCNGVIYPVSTDGLAATDRREASYHRVQVPPGNLTMLDGSAATAVDGVVWAYVADRDARQNPDPNYPIVQSYVDICLTGCIEVQETYPLAAEAGYAKMFIEETADWSIYWENDRLHPRRPHQYVPRAFEIDRLLSMHLTDLFAKIKLAPATWED